MRQKERMRERKQGEDEFPHKSSGGLRDAATPAGGVRGDVTVDHQPVRLASGYPLSPGVCVRVCVCEFECL